MVGGLHVLHGAAQRYRVHVCAAEHFAVHLMLRSMTEQAAEGCSGHKLQSAGRRPRSTGQVGRGVLLFHAGEKVHYRIYHLFERSHGVLLGQYTASSSPRQIVLLFTVRAARVYVQGVGYIKISETTHFPTLA